MPKKTRKQKINAQKRRATIISNNLAEVKQNIDKTIDTKSIGSKKSDNIDLTNTPIEVLTIKKDPIAQIIKKDLIKTVIIISVLFFFQLLIFYFT